MSSPVVCDNAANLATLTGGRSSRGGLVRVIHDLQQRVKLARGLQASDDSLGPGVQSERGTTTLGGLQ